MHQADAAGENSRPSYCASAITLSLCTLHPPSSPCPSALASHRYAPQEALRRHALRARELNRILGTATWAPQSGHRSLGSRKLCFLHSPSSPCPFVLASHRYAPHSSLWLGEASLTVTGRRRADISPARMLQALAPQRPLSLDRLPDTSLRVKRGLRVRAPTASSFGIEFVDVRDLVASPVDVVLLLILYCFNASFRLIPRPVRSGCTGRVIITLKIPAVVPCPMCDTIQMYARITHGSHGRVTGALPQTAHVHRAHVFCSQC